MLCLYIDELLITSSDEGYITKFYVDLMKKLEMNNLSVMTYFFGIEFHKFKKGLLVRQRRYAFEILKKFEMEHCKVEATLVEPRLQLL